VTAFVTSSPFDHQLINWGSLSNPQKFLQKEKKIDLPSCIIDTLSRKN